MKLNRCLECNTKFHYCTNCDYDAAQSDGFCRESCRRKYHDYDKFQVFYKEMIGRLPNKYQNLIDFVSNELWESWIYHKLGVKNDQTTDNN